MYLSVDPSFTPLASLPYVSDGANSLSLETIKHTPSFLHGGMLVATLS